MPSQKTGDGLDQFVLHLAAGELVGRAGEKDAAQHVPLGEDGRGGAQGILVAVGAQALMGGLVDFAGQLCETLNRTTGQVTVITDRDSCIAVAGVPRRELFEKAVSPQMERLMEGRQVYQYKPGEEAIPLCAT